MNLPEPRDLCGPLLRMGQFFLGDTLPHVESVRDVYAHGQDFVARGLPVTPSEAQFLREVTWCMLQIQHDQEESALHSALARVSALALAIIEDDDFTIPDGYGVGSRTNLEALAIKLRADHFQLNMSLGVTVASHDLSFTSQDDLRELAQRLPREDARLTRALSQIQVYIRQGEDLQRRQEDPQRAEAHQRRLDVAYERARMLLARLLTVVQGESEVLRAHLVRRELRHIEIDALGAKRITEAEQAAQAQELLAWTEEDLGEELTNENKATLAARLEDAAHENEEESGWLFEME